MRRYSIRSQSLPPAPDTNSLTWLKTPVLWVSVTAVMADGRGRGCALFVRTELVVARSWLPAGSEAELLLPEADPFELAGRGLDVMRILLAPDPLTVAEQGTLLVAPRSERDRDVQRVVETHVSEIAEAIRSSR